MNRFKRCLTIIALGFTVAACTVIHPYERVYIYDPQMQMSHNAGKNFSNYVHSIREGSIPAGSTKSSGGCGCN